MMDATTMATYFMLASYVVFVYYVMRGGNLVLGFLGIGLLWGVVAMFPVWPAGINAPFTSFNDFLQKILQQGILDSGTIFLTVCLGSWLGRVLMETGITASIIRKAVELGGDKPLVVCILLSLVTAAIFTSSFGSGVVIAVGIIILPILFALGVPKALATTSFIMSIATGTIINAVYYNQLSSMIPGYPNDNHFYTFGFIAMAINELCIFAMLAIGLRKNKLAKNWAANANLPEDSAPVWSFICPVVPVLMSMIFKWPTLPGFLFAIFMAVLLTGRIFRRDLVNMLMKAAHDGINDVSMLCVMIMFLQVYITIAAVNTPLFNATLGSFMPSDPMVLVVGIAVLSPIALFRGPLMWWGVGAATVALLSGLGTFSVPLLFQLMLVPTTFMATALCPTQGWNIWSLGYTKLNPKDILKWGFLPAWISCILCCVLSLIMG